MGAEFIATTEMMKSASSNSKQTTTKSSFSSSAGGGCLFFSAGVDKSGNSFHVVADQSSSTFTSTNQKTYMLGMPLPTRKEVKDV